MPLPRHPGSRAPQPTLLYSRAEVMGAISKVATTSSAAVEAAEDLRRHVDEAGYISLRDMRELLATHSEPGLVKLLTRELDEQILVEKVDEPTKARLKAQEVHRIRSKTESDGGGVGTDEQAGGDDKPVLEEDSLMEAMATVFITKSAASQPKTEAAAPKPESELKSLPSGILDPAAARQESRSSSNVQYVRRGSVIRIPATFGVGMSPATMTTTTENKPPPSPSPSDDRAKAQPELKVVSKRASIKEWWESEDSEFRTEKKEEAPTPPQPPAPAPSSSAPTAAAVPNPNGAQPTPAATAAYNQQVATYYATYYAQAAVMSAGAAQNPTAWTPEDMQKYQQYLQYYSTAFSNMPPSALQQPQPAQQQQQQQQQPTPQPTPQQPIAPQSRPASASVAPAASTSAVVGTDLSIEELAEIGRRTLLEQKQQKERAAHASASSNAAAENLLSQSAEADGAGGGGGGRASLPKSPLAALFAKPKDEEADASGGGGGKASLPKSPLAALFANRGAPPEGGGDAEKNDGEGGSKPGLPRSPLAAMLAGRGALGGRGGLGMGGRGPGGAKKSEEDDGPQMKKLHWETIKSTEGTIWGDPEANNVVSDPTSLFPDLKDHFEVTKAKPKSETELKPSSKVKTISLIDPKRSQNMNIMLAQFGKKSFEEIAEAITNLDEAPLGLAGISSLLDFIPEPDEIQKVKQYVDSGQDPAVLGKAERFVLAICKVTYLKQRLMALQVKCSFHDTTALLNEDVDIMIHACQETKGSTKFRSLLGIILKLGNELNKGTAKGSASGFKMSGLLKLTETKTNRGDTLLDYVVQSVFENMYEILELVDDFPSVGEASKKSFATLKSALVKVKSGLTAIENAIKLVEKEASSCACLDDLKNNFFAEAKEITAKSELKYGDMEKEFAALCKYLGEDEVGAEPQALFGTLSVFIGSLRTAIGKVQDKKNRKERAEQREVQRSRGASSAEGGLSSPSSGKERSPSSSTKNPRASMGGGSPAASADAEAASAASASAPAAEAISSSTGKAKRGKKREQN